jgi:toxin ParE1/3/4
MRIVWLDQADQDMFNTVEWLKERNPIAAKRITQLIYLQLKQLRQYPQLGRIGKIEGTRELVIHQTRYIAAYSVDLSKNIIEILALIHESQQWPAEF